MKDIMFTSLRSEKMSTTAISSELKKTVGLWYTHLLSREVWLEVAFMEDLWSKSFTMHRNTGTWVQKNSSWCSRLMSQNCTMHWIVLVEICNQKIVSSNSPPAHLLYNAFKKRKITRAKRASICLQMRTNKHAADTWYLSPHGVRHWRAAQAAGCLHYIERHTAGPRDTHKAIPVIAFN